MKNNEWINVLEPLKQIYELEQIGGVDLKNEEMKVKDEIYNSLEEWVLKNRDSSEHEWIKRLYLEVNPSETKNITYNFIMHKENVFKNYLLFTLRYSLNYSRLYSKNLKRHRGFEFYKDFFTYFLIPSEFTKNQFTYEKKGSIFIFSNDYKKIGVKIKILNGKIFKIKYEIPLEGINHEFLTNFISDIEYSTGNLLLLDYIKSWVKDYDDTKNENPK